VAYWLRRTRHRVDSSRVPRPCHHTQRDAPAPSHEGLRRILQPKPDASRTEERFAFPKWTEHDGAILSFPFMADCIINTAESNFARNNYLSLYRMPASSRTPRRLLSSTPFLRSSGEYRMKKSSWMQARLRLCVATGLAVGLLVTASATLSSAQADNAADLCAPDVMRLCNEFVPDAYRDRRLPEVEATRAER
jgi:hypothetical protein